MRYLILDIIDIRKISISFCFKWTKTYAIQNEHQLLLFNNRTHPLIATGALHYFFVLITLQILLTHMLFLNIPAEEKLYNIHLNR